MLQSAFMEKASHLPPEDIKQIATHCQAQVENMLAELMPVAPMPEITPREWDVAVEDLISKTKTDEGIEKWVKKD